MANICIIDESDPKIAVYAQSIRSSLWTLEKSLALLSDKLGQSSGGYGFVEGVNAGGDSFEAAGTAYSTLDLAEDDDANAALICVGVLGVNNDIYRHVGLVNSNKKALEDEFATMADLRVYKKGSNKRRSDPLARVVLREIGRAGLNRLGCYRQIQRLDECVESISFSRCWTRAVYRKTAEELSALIDRRHPSADHDYAVLEKHSAEHIFALVRPYRPTVRANCKIARDKAVLKIRRAAGEKLSAYEEGKKQVGAHLPIIVPLEKTPVAPRVTMPTTPATTQTVPPPDRDVANQRKKNLQEAPFLKSIMAYEYTPEYLSQQLEHS